MVRLGNRVNELESAKSDAVENTQKSNNAYVGVKSGDRLGEYILATYSDKETEVNSLHVFDGEMKETGVLNEIARGELVYAARFVGNYVYFITYK